MAAVLQNVSTKIGGQNLEEISPTYISSDLFSPEQKNRITIPTSGYQAIRPVTFCTGTWGEHATGYGGIGKLPYLEKLKVKELDIPRSHKHFGSGLSKYETTIQPYRHTPLVLSDGRLNDQMLPASLSVPLDPVTYNPQLASPRPWRHKYTTHVCQHDVFPSHDPNRTDGHGEAVLSDATSSQLRRYYNHLYYNPQYSETFPDRTTDIHQLIDQKAEAVARDARQRAEKYYARPEPAKVATDNAKIIHTEEIRKCLAEAAGPCMLTSTLLRLIEDASLEELHVALCHVVQDMEHTTSCVRKEQRFQALKIAQVINDCLKSELAGKSERLANTRRIRAFLRILNRPPACKKVDAAPPGPLTACAPGPTTSTTEPSCAAATTATSSALASIGTAWPPSNSQVMDQLRMRLKEVERLTPSDVDTDDVIKRDLHGKVIRRAPRDPAPNLDYSDYLSGWVDELQGGARRFEPPPPPPGLPTYTDYLNKILPVKIQPEVEQDAENDEHKTGPPEKPAPAPHKLPPLQSLLKPTGSRIQDRLGISFKMAAHRRYHMLYPEPIPDLRDSEILKKRYFFYGYHASAFRG